MWVRVAVLATLVAVAWLAVRMGLLPWLQLNRIQAEIGYFRGLVRQHEMLAILILGGLYFLATVLSLPFGIFLSVLLGYLLGRWMGTSLIVCSATAGALTLFVLARWFLGRWIRSRLDKQPQAALIARGFEHH
ncbi:mercuric reductase, partial [mine drainage metagenome]